MGRHADIAIVITFPITLLGRFILLQTRSTGIHIFSQISPSMLVGLAANNSIPVGKAADQRASQGVEIFQAAAEA